MWNILDFFLNKNERNIFFSAKGAVEKLTESYAAVKLKKIKFYLSSDADGKLSWLMTELCSKFTLVCGKWFSLLEEASELMISIFSREPVAVLLPREGTTGKDTFTIYHNIKESSLHSRMIWLVLIV